MQLEAIYNDGRIEFHDRVRFAHQRFKVRIDVPDEEIEAPPIAQPAVEPAEMDKPWKKNLHPDTSAVLERLEGIKQSMLAMRDDQFPELTEEQEERIRAFRIREGR